MVPAETKITDFRVGCCLGFWLRVSNRKKRRDVSHQTWLQVTETALRLAWATRGLFAKGSCNHGMTQIRELGCGLHQPSIAHVCAVSPDLRFSPCVSLILSKVLSLQRWTYGPQSCRFTSSLPHHLRKAFLGSIKKKKKLQGTVLIGLVWVM